MSFSTNEKVWYKKNNESNLERTEFITQKGHNTAIEKGNSMLLDHADQIRLQGEYEYENEEEFSTISSVNELLEQPWQNEMLKNEIMHD